MNVNIDNNQNDNQNNNHSALRQMNQLDFNMPNLSELSIAVFSFNTEAQIYCGNSRDSHESDKNDSTKCLPSDFVVKYINRVTKINNNLLPDIFIVHLQESSIKNPLKKFKTNNLAKRFEEEIKSRDANYFTIGKKLKGIGREGLRGLSSSIIMSGKIFSKYTIQLYRPLFSNSSVSITRGQQYGKGAICFDFKMVFQNKVYSLQCINTHLPFNGSDHDKIARDVTLVETLQYFGIGAHTKNTLVVGDLNYRVDFGNDRQKVADYLVFIDNAVVLSKEKVAQMLSQYKLYDQLKDTIKTYLPEFKEGIDNQGPTFLPTCKMMKQCSLMFDTKREYQINAHNKYRIPSWCDRIIYTDFIQCIYYDNFDYGLTCKSDHMAKLMPCGEYLGCGTGYGSNLGYNFNGCYGYGDVYGYGNGYGSYHDGWRVASSFGPFGYGCGPYGACGPCSGIYRGVNYYRRFCG